MKLCEFYYIFHQALQRNYPLKEERESLFFLLVCDVLKRDKTTIRLELIHQETLDKTAHEILEERLLALKNNQPIQYILGRAYFFGSDWIVDPRVLIPRPETEELISWVIEDHFSNPAFYLLDVGTGSGCIAISLKDRFPNATIYALDVSREALEVARQNAIKHKAKIFFHQLDVLLTPLPKSWPLLDVVVSNPPYVRRCEKMLMHPNVYQYEPDKALFVPNEDPLIFYRKIAEQAQKKLSTCGTIYFELNPFLAVETANLIKELGYTEVEIRKDIYGNLRMLKARLDRQISLNSNNS